MQDTFCLLLQLPYFRGRLFLFSHQKVAIIRGRRLFQVFLTGGRALYILFYFTKQLKCLYGQQGFYSYGTSILCKKVF